MTWSNRTSGTYQAFPDRHLAPGDGIYCKKINNHVGMLYRISLMQNKLFDNNGLSFKWIIFLAQVLHYFQVYLGIKS